MAPKTVWMAARATGNPYMTLLVDHLEARGLELHCTEPQHHLAFDMLRYGRPDVLHIHWLNTFFLRGKPSESALSTAYARFLAGWFVRMLEKLKRRGVGLVWTAHNAHNHANRQLEADRICHEAVVANADAIIAHSDTAKQMLVEEFDIERPDKVRVIEHGHYIGSYADEASPESAREALGLGDAGTVFVYFGRIRPYKNIPRLVDAFCDFKDRAGGAEDATLVVAGSAKDDALEAEIRGHIGQRDDIIFRCEFIPDDDVQTYMRAADVVVLPYREILTSGTAVLAMSFARPVIGPRLGTMCDVLDDQEELLYPIDDDEHAALIAAMGRAVELGRDELAAAGQRNLERARSWDWPGVAEATHNIYEEILTGR
jgi:beta-1,4-mannosyltransferase